MSYARNPIPFNTKFNKITYVIIFTKRIMIEILLYKYIESTTPKKKENTTKKGKGKQNKKDKKGK